MVKINLKDKFHEYKYIFKDKTGQTDFYRNGEIKETTWNNFCEEEFIRKIKESVNISNVFNKCQELKIINIEQEKE